MFISQKPRHGKFPCSLQAKDADMDSDYYNVVTSYLPSNDYSGEDTFNFFYLHTNMSRTVEENVIRVIVRPIPVHVKAIPDHATMTTDDDHVRIAVLENDVTNDKVDVCITRHGGANHGDGEARFEDVATKLGMTSIQALPPKAPDCLFDQYDPKLKVFALVFTVVSTYM